MIPSFHRCWVYERTGIRSIQLSRGVNAKCIAKQTAASNTASEGVSIKIDLEVSLGYVRNSKPALVCAFTSHPPAMSFHPSVSTTAPPVPRPQPCRSSSFSTTTVRCGTTMLGTLTSTLTRPWSSPTKPLPASFNHISSQRSSSSSSRDSSSDNIDGFSVAIICRFFVCLIDCLCARVCLYVSACLYV